MNVNFKYTYADYQALTRALEKHGKFAKHSRLLMNLVILVNLGISVIFITLSLLDGNALKPLYFVNAGLGFGLFLLFYVLRPFYLRRYYNKQMLDGKEVNLDFSDKGLSVEMPNLTATHAWEAIIRMDEEPEHFLLWINKIQAYSVPKRGFSDESKMEEFRALTAEKVNSEDFTK